MKTDHLNMNNSGVHGVISFWDENAGSQMYLNASWESHEKPSSTGLSSRPMGHCHSLCLALAHTHTHTHTHRERERERERERNALALVIH